MRGAAIERFEVQRSVARHLVLSAIQWESRARSMRGIVPGTRFRDPKTSALLRRLSTRRYAFPTYVLAYYFRGKVHRAVVNGQDPSVVMGDVPRSYRWVWLVLLGLAGLVLLLLGGFVALLILACAMQ